MKTKYLEIETIALIDENATIAANITLEGLLYSEPAYANIFCRREMLVEWLGDEADEIAEKIMTRVLEFDPEGTEVLQINLVEYNNRKAWKPRYCFLLNPVDSGEYSSACYELEDYEFEKTAYTLVKIDLIDALPTEEHFDIDRYEEIHSEIGDLQMVLASAIVEFKELNRGFRTWEDWLRPTSEERFEMEILIEEPESIFRASIMLRHPMIESALNLAIEYHQGQIRKADGLDYMLHILEITRLLDRRGFHHEILVAAFCHDLLEETDCQEEVIESECGSEVLRIVKACTSDPLLEGKEKKKKYIESVLAGGEKAIAVCIADKIVNLRTLLRMYRRRGKNTWSRFNESKAERLWFERQVLGMAQRNWHHPLVEEYGVLVDEVERIEE